MTVDLDSLIAEARRLIAHTRTYNFGMWSADKLAHKVAGQLADALESLHKDLNNESEDWWRSKWEDSQAELRQERERADESEASRDQFRTAWNAYGFEIIRLEDTLSRAEETIEKAIACEEHTHRIMTDRKPTREDSSLTWRILTEYGEQKEADRG